MLLVGVGTPSAAGANADSLTVRTPSPETLERFRSNDDYQYDQVSGSTILGALMQWLMAYWPDTNLPPVFEELQWVVVAIVTAAIIGFALYWIAQSRSSSAFRSSERSRRPPMGVSVEDMERTDFAGNAAAAREERRFRDAVRLRYLAVLQTLYRAGRIEWRSHQTNSDFVRALQNTPLYDDFRQATRIYEYVWYGGASARAEHYDRIDACGNRLASALDDDPAATGTPPNGPSVSDRSATTSASTALSSSDSSPS